LKALHLDNLKHREYYETRVLNFKESALDNEQGGDNIAAAAAAAAAAPLPLLPLRAAQRRWF
jgi:hypothetical protein